MESRGQSMFLSRESNGGWTHPGTVWEYASAILKKSAWNSRSRTFINEF